MKYKYITVSDNGECFCKKTSYYIKNNRSGDTLGGIAWYPAWRCYCAYFAEGAVFNNSCLRDIADFIENHAGKETGNV